MDWQPIETAPKDGTVVLLWEHGSALLGRWTHHYSGGKIDPYRKAEWESVPSGPMSQGGEPPMEPTHWMPIPEGP